jgi:uncharacterized membrane protein
MKVSNESYGLLSETSGIDATRNAARQRHLPAKVAFRWLRAGWQDFSSQRGLSLLYGFGVLITSYLIIGSMFFLGWEQILFPAVAGFLVVGPVIAIGLYEKSRALEQGKAATLRGMLIVNARSGNEQVLFVGVLLCLMMLLWMRAAVIIYALFFSYSTFLGLDSIVPILFETNVGRAMLIVGTFVGGLFAAFGFATSAFSITMLLDEKTDALTAMGTSMAFVWNNLRVMIPWGAVVLTLTIACVMTGLVGLIVVFPLLGHATWHAYMDICRPRDDAATTIDAPQPRTA